MTPPEQTTRQRLWRGIRLGLLLLLTGFVLLTIELVLIKTQHLSPRIFVFSVTGISIIYAVAGMVSIGLPSLKWVNKSRREGLEDTFYSVMAREFKPAPDEVLFFKYMGWWDKSRHVTKEGKAALERALTRQSRVQMRVRPNPNKRPSLAERGRK
ncbi:hypothetical protein Dxin01_00745 [Deinococcus xinjiangensis]|uniref:Uncharacterized protein n=1 Tax=Deinococcus xinjiangensis TaxID=457454 RepID=A0ABP9V6X0_9DEIO